MYFVLFIIKFYIVILCLRYVSTNQELMFNPMGKVIGYLTNPLFKNIKLAKEQSDKYIPLMIILLIVLAFFLQLLSSDATLYIALKEIITVFALFFMQLFVVSALLGVLAKQQYASYYLVYFFRLGMPFVKFTSKITTIKSVYVTIPAVIIIFALYLIIATLPTFIYGMIKNSAVVLDNLYAVIRVPLSLGLLGLTKLILYMSFLLMARALMSWVSPDPRSSIVQIIYSLTEPILAPFRKIIPPIGMIDLSAFVAIFLTYILSNFLTRLILTYV